MNKVFLIGRLTRDPDLKYSSTNVAVCNITVAVNRPFQNQKGQREADFINVSVWRKQAENVKNYLTKGSQVAVDGRIQTRNYDDKDGKKVYVTEVIAENVQFLDSKRTTESQNTNNPTPYDFNNNTNNTNNTNVDSDPFASFGETIDISDDDLPF